MSPTTSINGKTKSERDDLDHIRSTASIPISPELFEQLYLQPQNRVKGDLRKTFGNPTPPGEELLLTSLAGFLMCATPASMALLGWQGAGGFAGAANVGVYFGFGSLLTILGGIGEWILVDFPITLPVGDLSTIIRGKSDSKKDASKTV
ncbi:hypothetical protein IL306_004697 [Fusarium sp. DS 682]|nr:hypothetical protein IL306_004697 [Fusarium sp. DS 682]